uniref:K1 n=1 Tax=Human herpesvirus 8 TaxID=37296 RepID=Q9DSF0_HHV8|nr:K1 protein [Human gammaherpesvirus 8]QLF96911.1 K1 [Human gammaherpesvirus 8]WBG93830.1 K1 glycoprotein [Human gammaherpesvirus 8]WBG93843.1 K1 glycoprotein [Human gammaherpesvirus 8]WBG93844.1 K1 glycoprotein [Human gammaherpesvirus 8]
MFLYVVCSLAVCFRGLLSLSLQSSPNLCPGVISTPYTLTCPSNTSLPTSWYCNDTRLLRLTQQTITVVTLICNFSCVGQSGHRHSLWITWYPQPVLQTLCGQPSNTVTCGQHVTLYCSTSGNNVTVWHLPNGRNETVSQTKYYNFTLMDQTEGCYACSDGLLSRLSNRLCFSARCANITLETNTVSVSSTTGFRTFSTNSDATTHDILVMKEAKSTNLHIQVHFLVFMTLVALIGTMCGILGTIIFAHCQKQSDSNKTVPQQLRDYYSLHDLCTEDYTQPVDWY